MAKASESLEFEKAAKLRDQIAGIENLLQRQKVLVEGRVDQDVIAVVKDDRGSAIQMLYIRGGKLIGQQNYILDGSKDASPTEAVQEFVKQYYSSAHEIHARFFCRSRSKRRRSFSSGFDNGGGQLSR